MITTFRDIKTFNDVLEYLGLDEDDFYESFNPEIISKEFVIWNLIMKAFIKISNDRSQLLRGSIYYPYCYIVWKNRATEEENEIKVRDCIINDREAFLVGGTAAAGSSAGLGLSASINAAATSGTSVGFRAFSSYEVAKHVSKYFAKELFDFSLGWRSNEIQWL